ncbi:MAG: protein kinase domain-containing protein [Anaerolineae bacterium]
MVELTGRVLKSYELRERIGVGGFGAVYRAMQTPIEREVAIKIILPEHANKAEFVRRFEVEAQLVARLEHPHIVPLYDYWREPGGAYLVMRYLRGGSLRDSLEQNGAWDATHVAQMLTQIGMALAFAHVNGVVHRDLKTDNILLDESGNSYLTDFGIAKDLGIQENYTKDAILGTPAYLSPEQIRGETASFRSDIYALGILIFEALTATKPFYNATPATILYKQLNEPLPDLKEFRDDLPDDLNIILQRATSKDPELRYQSAIQLTRDFRAIISDNNPGMPATGNATIDVLSITEEQEQLFNAVNPYKGLQAFQTADADNFFGRDTLVNELLDHLALSGQNHDFLAVVGPSGSGKSSVVKAGMLPRIQAGVLDEEQSWFTADITPGTHPMEELEVALLAISTSEIPDLYETLTQDERGLVRVIKRIIPDQSQFVLFIDQFEELFTLVQDNDERVHFLNSILNAIEDERSRIKIVVTLRADFYDRPLLYANFGNLIRQHTELVLPLNRDELEASITLPAERARINLEPGLVEAIINDVIEQPGALPLLQYALTELFERREGRVMMLKAYREIGGTTGALARRAEELYQNFSAPEQAATRQMFLRLVTLGEGTDDTRRRIFQSELLSLNEQSHAMPRVIEQFGKYRLLTFDHDPQTRSSTIEVAHEALIRQWERMRRWLDDNREALRLHRRLTAAADEWNHARRDPSFLVSGMRLEQFKSLIEETNIALNENELIYLNMSIEARQRREQEERQRQQREQELEARDRRRLRLLASVMTIAALVGIALAVFAFSEQQRAEQQAVIARDNAATATVAQGQALESANARATAAAEALQNEAETRALALAANARNAANGGDPQLALVLALEAQNAFSPAPIEVVRTLADITYAPGPRARYDLHDGSVTSVEFSANSQLMVTSSVDGTVHVIDTLRGEATLSLSIDDGWFYDADIHPNQTSIAAAASDGLIYVWSYPSGNLLYRLRGHTDEVMTVDYNPVGNVLASGGKDHDIHLWDLRTGELTRTLSGHEGVVLNVVFSPDGTRLVSSSADETLGDTGDDIVDRTVRIWDTRTGEATVVINPRSGFVRAVDFSPAGDTITYGVWDSSASGTVRVHDVETGDELQRFPAHTTPITAVAYNADGTQVASVAWDRTVRIWDLVLGVEADSFVGFDDRVLSMAYSPDGESLALGIGNIGDNIYTGDDRANNQTVWVWDIQIRNQIDAFTEHPDWHWTVDISADGTLSATGGGPLRPIRDPESDPEGWQNQLEAATVLVWETTTQNIVARLSAHELTVDSVRFHPDNQRLLTSAWDSQLILWDIDRAEIIRTYDGHTGAIYMVRFFDEGAKFVSVGGDGLALIWDTETGELLGQIEHDTGFNGVDIHPDGSQLAITSNDGNIYLYDIVTSERLQTLSGHEATVNEVRYHPTGNYLVSTSWDATVRVWDISTGTETRQFNGHNSETFGIDLSTDGRILLTTSSDRTVRMWDWASGEELQSFTEHSDWIQEVVFGPDEQIALSAGQDPATRIWRINRDATSLTQFARTNRYIRELSCSERDVYRLSTCE